MCAGGRSNSRSMTPNIVAFAPMPSAKTSTDANAKPRCVLNTRMANPASWRNASSQSSIVRAQAASIDACQFLPRCADVAVRRERAFAGFGRRVATRDQFGDAILEVKSDLVVHFARDGS